jgi:hypothetical protein
MQHGRVHTSNNSQIIPKNEFYLWIYDKTSIFESKNDFWKKLWASYGTVIVQIYPASS